jgi:DNA (cytosine-5)-methyltransferase 1
MNNQKIFKTIDLFAGIGGVRLGFENTNGFKTVYANDFDKYCKITYDLNFETVKLDNIDIRDLKSDKLPKYDILLGGFPCQAFSIAGYRQGFEDEKGRGNLFFEIDRIIKDTQPIAFFLENVKNLEKHDQGRTFKIISDRLTELGYLVKYKILNSMEYGDLPQNRERVYIVGFKNKKHYDNFEFPKSVERKKSIKDMLDFQVDEKYLYNNKTLFEKLKDSINREDTAYQWRRKYVRENKNNVFPTLTANMGMGGHNVPIVKQGNVIRKITPRECSRVQGFPVNYKLPQIADSQLYKQFGNSVSVPVIERIAEKLYFALNQE